MAKFLDKTGLDTFWAKIKSTFQTLGNLVTTSTGWSSTPSDTKYPSEKLVKTSLDAKAPNAPSEVTIATGDKPLIADSSDSNKVKRASAAFDTGVPTTYLCRNGTFNAVKERDVAWGGSFRTTKSPIETFTKQNSFFYPKPSAVSVEYSNNRTAETPTWTDYGLTDNEKRALFSGNENSVGVYCGKKQHVHPGYTGSAPYKDLSNENIADQGLRITIACRSLSNRTTDADNWIYCYLRGILLYMSTQSAGAGAHCVVEKQNGVQYKANQDEWVTFGDYKIQGDPGWNSIPYDGTFGGGWSQTSNYSWVIRFTIWSDQLSATPDSGQTGCLLIRSIAGINHIVWTSTNPVQRTGFPFSYNYDGTMTLMQPLPIASGGTGATTARGAMYNTLGQETTLDSTLDDNRLVPIRNNEVSAANGVFRWFKLINVWNYIKSQISSVLGLTATDYGGNAATATTAAGYTNDGAIATALGNKQDDLGISSSGDTSKFLNEKGQWAKPDNDCIVMIQTTTTSAEVDDILNDGKLPVLVVGSGSIANYYQFMKVTSGAYIFGRVFEDYIYTYTLAAGTWTLSSTQLASYSHVHGNLGNDGKSTSEPTSTIKFLRADGSWQVPSQSLQYWSGGSTNIKGVYIGTCNIGSGAVGWITGTMSVTNYYGTNPTTTNGKGIALGSFYLWAYRVGTTVTASCRLYSLNARHTNTDLMLVYKKDTSDDTTYKVRFYVCFGPGVTGGGTSTNQRPFGLGISYLENHNADIPESLTGITNDIQYDDDYYSIFKMPYLAQGASGVGGAARPVYVNSSGQVTACNDAKFYSSGWNEIDYTYRSHFVISSSQNGRGFTIDVTKLAENVSYELGAVLVDSGNLRFQLKFKKTSSNYYLYGCRNNGTNLVSADVETTNRPEDNVRVVRIGTNVYVIGY